MGKITDTITTIKSIWGGGAYEAAQPSRHRATNAFHQSRPVDEDKAIGSHGRSALRLEARNLYRNDPLARAIVTRFANNVIGANGITPQARTNDFKWNEKAESYFDNWSKYCDSREILTLKEISKILVISQFLDGESFVLLTDDGKLQPIEAERVATPTNAFEPSAIIRDGVRLDKSGKILGYYICNRDEGGYINNEDWSYVEKKNVIHLTRSTRFDQIRGIPELAPVINSIRDYSELSKATLQKAKLDAFRAFALKREKGSKGGPSNLGARNGSPNVDLATTPPIEKIGMSQVYHLGTDESIDPLESKTPNSQYDSFSVLTMRLIGAAIGMPYELLLLDFTKGNYGASRAALQQTYTTFENWQRWLIEQFLQKVWNWRIGNAIQNKELISAPIVDGVSTWFYTDWTTPSRDWIDPLKESLANEREYLLGTTTLTELNKRKGRDTEDVLREKAKDISVAIRIAQEVSAETGVTISHYDLSRPSLPGLISPDAGMPLVEETITNE